MREVLLSNGAQQTGTRDEHYNLVSVLYPTLQQADTIGRYADDARAAGDEEFVRFFQELQDDDRRRAERVEQPLGDRIPAMSR